MVSIHAPTRGATVVIIKPLRAILFQSTHPRGVRQQSKTLSFSLSCFNPRTHEGCDCRYFTQPRKELCFNPRTHEGCDGYGLFANSTQRCFNPRTHEGCDVVTEQRDGKVIYVSIHAPTRGATCNGVATWKMRSFNPRTHEGCDRSLNDDFIVYMVSIHAPTRGATAYSAKYRILIYKSSHFANINQTITFKVIKSLEFL